VKIVVGWKCNPTDHLITSFCRGLASQICCVQGCCKLKLPLPRPCVNIFHPRLLSWMLHSSTMHRSCVQETQQLQSSRWPSSVVVRGCKCKLRLPSSSLTEFCTRCFVPMAVAMQLINECLELCAVEGGDSAAAQQSGSAGVEGREAVHARARCRAGPTREDPASTVAFFALMAPSRRFESLEPPTHWS
jgi:hypothetical protein